MMRKYVDMDKIKKIEADYKLLIGQRSNGKTTGCLDIILEDYVKHKKQGAIIRRYDTDFTGGRGDAMFRGLVSMGRVYDLTGGAWTDILYKSRRWYLCKYDEELDKIITDTDPLAYAFSISGSGHDKSTSYPGIKNILFDEFLARQGEYLPDEFVRFMNLLSTIIRGNDGVTIYMCGNTVSKYSPYYNEMGLHRIKSMQPGDIDLYTYGDSKLRVAVYFTDRVSSTKTSEKYFAFNNPKLSMITGKGDVWEIGIHPRSPVKYRPADVRFRFVIVWDNEYYLCEIVKKDNYTWVQVSRKTTPIKDPDKTLVYTPTPSMSKNYRRNILRPTSQRDKIIAQFFASGKVAYQDNNVGEAIAAYLAWCGKKIN